MALPTGYSCRGGAYESLPEVCVTLTVQHVTGVLTGGPVPIFWQAWRPTSPGGVPLVLAHGLGEHSGRYRHVAEFFAARGLPVWALDHRGFGRSGGRRVYVDRFHDYLDDLRRFIGHVTATEGARPVLVGHSMGGLISARYAQEYQDTLQGLVLSSPYLKPKVKIPLHLRLAAPLLAVVAPRLAIRREGSFQDLARDPEVGRQAAADSLWVRVVTPRWHAECLRHHAVAQERAPRLLLPVLFLVAGDDRIVDPQATRAFFERVPEPKRWHGYPEKYHEVFNDYGYLDVLADLWAWLVENGFVHREGEMAPLS